MSEVATAQRPIILYESTPKKLDIPLFAHIAATRLGMKFVKELFTTDYNTATYLFTHPETAVCYKYLWNGGGKSERVQILAERESELTDKLKDELSIFD